MQIVVGLWGEACQADLEVAERHDGVAEQGLLVHLVGDALGGLVEEQGDGDDRRILAQRERDEVAPHAPGEILVLALALDLDVHDDELGRAVARADLGHDVRDQQRALREVGERFGVAEGDAGIEVQPGSRVGIEQAQEIGEALP